MRIYSHEVYIQALENRKKFSGRNRSNTENGVHPFIQGPRWTPLIPSIHILRIQVVSSLWREIDLSNEKLHGIWYLPGSGYREACEQIGVSLP